MSREEFAITPSDLRLVWLLPALAALGVLTGILLLAAREPHAWVALPVALAAFTVLALLLRRRSIGLEGGIVTIAAGFNTRRIAVSDLDLAAARIVDLREHKEWKPWMRMFGTRLPGLWMGHFRLRDRSPVFVLMTDTSRVLLPGRSGRKLLLSPQRPQALLDALRRFDAGTTHRR